MFGFRQKRNAAGPPQAQPAVAEAVDATGAFPRGLPDENRMKPAATARWFSAEEIAAEKLLPAWQPGMLLLGRDHHGRYYGHADDRHVLTVAGSRAGKGVSLIVPNLLFWPGSVIAIDPKGELATITASRRHKDGSDWAKPIEGEGEVYALDPFNRVTGEAKRFAEACFNPMDGLDPNSDEGADLAYQLADALIVQAQGEGVFWTQSARGYLRALILHVAATEPPDSCHLVRVRQLIMLSEKDRETLFHEMKVSDDPIVSGMGSAMLGRTKGEAGSILSSCEAQTTFLDGGPMRRVLCGRSSFRLEDLKAKRITVYLCLPAMRLETHGRWLRLFVQMAVDAMERTGPLQKGKPAVLFVLDEFAALGRMTSIEKAAGQIASFGAKLWPIVQDLTQLQRDYKEAWETFMGNAGCLTFFGNTDVTTTNHIMQRLGSTEIVSAVINGQDSWGSSTQPGSEHPLALIFGQANGSRPQTNTQGGGSRSFSQQVTVAPLMHGSEVTLSFARETGKLLVLVPDKPPLALFRCIYHDQKDGALFGGLYDQAPGQDAPHTDRAQREKIDEGRA